MENRNELDLGLMTTEDMKSVEKVFEEQNDTAFSISSGSRSWRSGRRSRRGIGSNGSQSIKTEREE